MEKFGLEFRHSDGKWSMRKCECNHDMCEDFFVSITKSDGRMIEANALLTISAPEMLDQLCRTYLHLLTHMDMSFRITSQEILAGLRNNISTATGISGQVIQDHFKWMALHAKQKLKLTA